jgi:hypothetical protein
MGLLRHGLAKTAALVLSGSTSPMRIDAALAEATGKKGALA